MGQPSSGSRRHFTEAARRAAVAARAAKRAEAEPFGFPDLFVVRAGDHGFTWELRRFGGLVLQHGLEAFDTVELARADGEKALAALRASPDLPTFERPWDWRSPER